MSDPEVGQKGEITTASRPARFGGLDQLDWLMILISVLLGTVAQQKHFLDLPDWFLEWVFPFLVMAVGYKTRRRIADLIQSRRAKPENPSSE